MNRKTLRYVTRHFYDLQGLRLIPFGAFFLFAGVAEVLPSPLDLALQLALLAATVLSYWPITQFYKEQYGHVKTDQQWFWQTLGLAGLMIGGLLVDIFLSPPVSAAGIGAGLYLVALWRPQLGARPGGLRWYYAVAGLGVLGGTLYVGFAGPADFEMYGLLSTLIYGLGGAVFIFCGLLDHLTLVRTLSTATLEEDVASAAEAHHV